MRRPQADPDLPLPEPPGRSAPLGRAAAALTLAHPAGAGRVLVDGGGAAAWGPQRRHLAGIRIGGRVVAADLAADWGVPANIDLSPGRLRREWVGRTGSLLETILVPESVALVALQWTAPGGSPDTISLTLLPDAAGVSYRAGAAVVSARASDRPDEIVAAALDPPPAAWTVEPLEGGGVRVEARGGGPAERRTLVLAAGSANEVQRTFRAAAHLGAHEVRATGAPSGGLVLTTGVPEVDDGLAWARIRVGAALHRSLEALSPEARARGSGLLSHAARAAFWCGLGAIAGGDGAGAARALELLELGDSLEGHGALLAARLALAFGGTGPAKRHAEALMAGAAGNGAVNGMRTLALSTLADALRHAAPDAFIKELRARAELGRTSSAGTSPRPGGGVDPASQPTAGLRSAGTEPGSAPAPDAAPPTGSRRGRSARRLPMARPPREPASLAAWLGPALDGTAQGPPPLGHVPAEGRAALEAWAAAAADPDAAWVAWRRLVAEGLEDGPAGPGTWDGVEGSGLSLAPAAALLVSALAHGTLGLAPDAPVGRIGIALRLPGHLTRLAATGITVGGAELSLAYERTAGVHHISLEPGSGRVPPVVVLEPRVTGKVVETRVDGRVADLEAIADGKRTLVRVQIPLDAPRTLEIVTR